MSVDVAVDKSLFCRLLKNVTDIDAVDEVLGKQGYDIDCELRSKLGDITLKLSDQLAELLKLKTDGIGYNSISWWLEGRRSGQCYLAKAPGERVYRSIKTPEMLWDFMVKCGEINDKIQSSSSKES